MNRLSGYAILSLCAAGLLAAQEPPQTEPPAPGAPPVPVRPALTSPSQDPQPYEKVITKDAKTKNGVFLVHQIKDKYYYEIPKGELNKLFLWNTGIAKTVSGLGYGHQEVTNRVIHWELNGNKVHLRDDKYEIMADAGSPIARAVEDSNNNTIIMTFPVAAFNKEGAPVIEVTRLFSTDVQEFSPRQGIGATALDATRSFIERISPYPENIEAEASMTYTRQATPPGMSSSTPSPAPSSIGGPQMRPGSATLVLHHSMVKLPEQPMKPRLFDERVGYFTASTYDYSSDEHRAERVRFITRWRLEKKDPNAAVSEPVKPIVYYVDSATPVKWREWIKKGIEDWQPAFEAAGFRNAIAGKMAPTPQEDPEFSYEDVRHSVIRWLPSTVENAMGPNIHDPRSGEILNAPILFFHNIMNLQRSWYFLQAGPLDPRAQKLPLPDDLMGRLLEYVVAHEVGHTLGFQHNMKSSSTYPQEKVRDAAWVHEKGHTPSIMDYSRFNYVAQPEDKIPPEDLVPRIGPYDIWATKWGYTPIPDAKTPADERATLDKWAREQDSTPWYRFSTAGSMGSDPGNLTEAVGDADAVKSTSLGLRNLQRVAKMLMPATTTKPGEPYDDLAELYGRMLGQWALELNHVAAIVGGFDSQQKAVGQEGVLYSPVSKARQEQAVKFLNDNAFATPAWAIDRDVLRRIEPVGVLNRINSAQRSVLNNLLSSARFARLVEAEAIDGASAYSAADLLAAVRKGIWKELDTPAVRIDAYRRNLQHSYLDLVNSKVNGAAPSLPAGLPAELVAMIASGSSTDEKPLYRAELKSLSASVGAALAKTADRSTRAHLEAARDQIARILDPKFNPATSVGGNVIRVGIDGDDPLTGIAGPATCWPDYIIRP
ncbi:MAG TPA: zinc-dependent metalloprotease [Candidatus Acidoferrales bacterium]|nr:zinc-dependent metalloprotease [Candidatus Acidoferrales bacterium]